MIDFAIPALFTVFIWWFATGAVFWVGGQPVNWRQTNMVVMSLVALVALFALVLTRNDQSLISVYSAFAATIIIWGWHELSFLYGFITGPRKTPCPPGASGIARFSAAFEALLYHELAILATGIGIALIGAGAENVTGTMTFFILWAMRISAKLNLFFGAPNVADDMMPGHLAYMKSYFRKSGISLFFPVSITLGTLGTAYLIGRAATATDLVGFTQAVLLGTLLALAVLEHWFFVMPFRETRLWENFKSQSKAHKGAVGKTNTAGKTKMGVSKAA